MGFAIRGVCVFVAWMAGVLCAAGAMAEEGIYTAEQSTRGEALYQQYCAACHGDRGQTRGANFPDLTRTPLLWSPDGFDAIVLKGLLKERGMASFAEVLKPADTALIRDFIIDQANELKKHPPPGAPPAAAGAHEQH